MLFENESLIFLYRFLLSWQYCISAPHGQKAEVANNEDFKWLSLGEAFGTHRTTYLKNSRLETLRSRFSRWCRLGLYSWRKNSIPISRKVEKRPSISKLAYDNLVEFSILHQIINFTEEGYSIIFCQFNFLGDLCFLQCR